MFAFRFILIKEYQLVRVLGVAVVMPQLHFGQLTSSAAVLRQKTTYRNGLLKLGLIFPFSFPMGPPTALDGERYVLTSHLVNMKWYHPIDLVGYSGHFTFVMDEFIK